VIRRWPQRSGVLPGLKTGSAAATGLPTRIPIFLHCDKQPQRGMPCWAIFILRSSSSASSMARAHALFPQIDP